MFGPQILKRNCFLSMMLFGFCLKNEWISSSHAYRSQMQTAGSTSCPWTTILVLLHWLYDMLHWFYDISVFMLVRTRYMTPSYRWFQFFTTTIHECLINIYALLTWWYASLTLIFLRTSAERIHSRGTGPCVRPTHLYMGKKILI